MGFLHQLERLRLIVGSILQTGQFTQRQLAEEIGVRQATISDFIQGKKTLSWKHASHLQDFLQITTRDLEDPSGSLSISVPDTVPVVSQRTARLVPEITPALILHSSGVPLHQLRTLPTSTSPDRLAWTRFVAIKVTRAQVNFLGPIVSDSTLLVIDRHSQRHDARSTRRRTIYAIHDDPYVGIGYLEVARNAIALHADFAAPRPFTLPSPDGLSALIIGRVCRIISDR